MSNEGTTPQHNALVMIVLRQLFYLRQLRLILGAFLLSVLFNISLVGMLIYFVKHPVHPIYFPTDNVGRLMVDVPLHQPNMPLNDVISWVTRAIEASYSYDFINYRGQLQGAQKYFVDYGWKQYMKGLTASNNLLALTQRKMIVSAKVVAAPKLLVQGIMGSRYAWKFDMPVLVTYWEPPYTQASQFANPLTISVTVVRQPLIENDEGLGIVQLIASLAVETNPENMTAPGG